MKASKVTGIFFLGFAVQIVSRSQAAVHLIAWLIRFVATPQSMLILLDVSTDVRKRNEGSKSGGGQEKVNCNCRQTAMSCRASQQTPCTRITDPVRFMVPLPYSFSPSTPSSLRLFHRCHRRRQLSRMCVDCRRRSELHPFQSSNQRPTTSEETHEHDGSVPATQRQQ